MTEISEAHPVSPSVDMSISNTLRKSENTIKQKNKRNSNPHSQQSLLEDERASYFDEYA